MEKLNNPKIFIDINYKFFLNAFISCCFFKGNNKTLLKLVPVKILIRENIFVLCVSYNNGY